MFALFGLLAGLLVSAPVSSMAIVYDGTAPLALDITPSLEMLPEDLSPADVTAAAGAELAGAYRPVEGPDVHLGYTDKVYWFRFTIAGMAESPPVLELSNAQLISVTLYTPTGTGDFDGRTVGIGHPFWERPLVSLTPSFPLRLDPSGTTTFYLRVQHYGALRFSAVLRDSASAREGAFVRIALNLLLAGALSALAIFNGGIYAGLRQPAYLWLSLMLIATTVNQMTFSGTANMLLWQEPSRWANHALTLTGMVCQGTGVAFSIAFLQSWRHTRRLAWVAVCFVILGTGVCLLSLAGEPLVFYGVVAYVLLGPVIIGLLTLAAGRRSPLPAGLFLFSWGFVLVGEVLFCMVYLDLLTDTPFFSNFMHASVLAASLIWSFSLTRQINTNARRQRALLEGMVAERTAELETAMKEVKTLEGLLPVCSNCKMIRDEAGEWQHMEIYVSKHTGADFSHSICPDCMTALYPAYERRGGRDNA